MPYDVESPPEVTAHGFLASQLTDNIRVMDDGTLVIENCPIARTGWQRYQVKDLPQQAARDLGVDMSNPHASIDLYRPAEEVFHPEFIASLEGRPICDNHPPQWVTPQNFNEYSKGHLQNVHKGDEPLEDGEWPLLADLVISAEPLVGKVRNKVARENSLGYDYHIRREGDKILQCDMVGNHNAVVPNGRAGDEVRIMDSADISIVEGSSSITTYEPPSRAAPPEPAASPPEPSAGKAVLDANAAPTAVKEKPKVKNKLLHIFGLGIRAQAADEAVSPEELAEMAADVGKVKDTDPSLFEVTESRDKGKRGRDEATIDPVDKDHEQANDKRKAMHDALDKLLDAMPGEDKRGRDTDIAELSSLLQQFMGEEASEAAHQQGDADPAELEELLGAGEHPDVEDTEAQPGEEILESGEAALEDAGDEEMECAHCGTAHDMENCPSCGCKDRKARARDRAQAADAKAGAAAVLTMLRPFVARCNDQAVKRAYNTGVATLRRRSVASSGSYGAVARAATARDSRVGTPPPHIARARAADSSVEAASKLQKYYDERRAQGGK